jgi:hypothetical protein
MTDKIKDLVNDIGKAIRHIDKDITQHNNNNNNHPNNDNAEAEKKAGDRARYNAHKARYDEHFMKKFIANTMIGDNYLYTGPHCTIETGCVPACMYFPPDGYLSIDGEFYYYDHGFDPEFYGSDDALEYRERYAALNAEQREIYKKEIVEFFGTPTLTEEFKRELREGKRLCGLMKGW